MFAVRVGNKYWCAHFDEEAHIRDTLATLQTPDCSVLRFVSEAEARAWGSRKMDDPNCNKFIVVPFAAPDTDEDEEQPAHPARKHRRKSRKGASR